MTWQIFKEKLVLYGIYHGFKNQTEPVEPLAGHGLGLAGQGWTGGQTDWFNLFFF